MITFLAWATLAVCGITALARIPSALRGENRSLFFLFLLMTLAVFLSIDAPYRLVDSALGGINIANVLLRFSIFGALAILGFRVARAFGAQDALRLISGFAGLVVLAFCSLVVVVVFLMMDTAGTSTGLVSLSARSPWNAVLLEFYGAAGRLYPAYVTLALLPAMLRALAGRLPVPVKAGAALLALGSIAITLTLLFPVFPPELGFAKFVLNYTAVLCLVLGLALIWLGSVVARRLARPKTAFPVIPRDIRSQNH